jgi:DNA polymerase III subunit epsilon
MNDKTDTILTEGQELATLPLVFFDVETTGLSLTRSHRICEFALLRVYGETVETSFSTLVNPQRPVDAGAFAVNGISPDMVRDAPTFNTIANTVLAAMDGAVLVAHNAPFDTAFLNHELHLSGYAPPDNPVIDTLILARQLLNRPSHSLKALASELGLHTPAHRAMSDVLALRGLFDHMHGLLRQLGVHTLGDMLRYQRGLMPGDREPTPPPLIDQAMREKKLLRIVYVSQSSGQTERVVQPLEMTMMRGKLCLRAYCHLRRDTRSFLLSKIEAMELE